MAERKEAWETRLNHIYQSSPVLSLGPEDRFVVFSDFHIGGRKRRDDFRQNNPMFQKILRSYYGPGGYTVILNGDFEELQRVKYQTISRRWRDLYQLLQEFQDQGRLYKIIGNHDIKLLDLPREGINDPLYEALRLSYRGKELFVFHGHQPTTRDTHPLTRRLSGWVLRYLAHPLGIKNLTRAHDNPRVLKTERRVYEFSRRRKIVSLIGHTHRPLFESLSEIDFHKFQIETLIRRYPEVSPEDQQAVRRRLREHKAELTRLYTGRSEFSMKGSLYNPVTLPCLFNSGCVIGKKGLTALEISGGRISLVYWYDQNYHRTNYAYEGLKSRSLPETPYHRVAMKEDDLDYIFRRIDLLADSQ